MARPVLHNAFCDSLRIEYPIFLAGMGVGGRDRSNGADGDGRGHRAGCNEHAPLGFAATAALA